MNIGSIREAIAAMRYDLAREIISSADLEGKEDLTSEEQMALAILKAMKAQTDRFADILHSAAWTPSFEETVGPAYWDFTMEKRLDLSLAKLKEIAVTLKAKNRSELEDMVLGMVNKTIVTMGEETKKLVAMLDQ